MSWVRWARSHSGVLALALSALVLLAISYGWRLSILQTRDFDNDEFQHLHSAWCISQGMLPYRDYFQHHPPGLHFLIAPLFRFFDVEHSSESALAFILLTRRLMWVCTGILLALLFLLGRDWRVGLVAVVLLINEHLFLSKTVEIRPDLLSVPLVLASLWALLVGLRASVPGLFFASGALLGASILFNQKSLFAVFPVALSLVWYVADRPSRLVDALKLAVGFCLPLLLMFSWCAWQGVLGEFIDSTLVRLPWKERFSPLEEFLPACVLGSPFAVALALTGFACGLARLFQRESVQRGDYLLILAFAGLLGGAFVTPVPWPQYHLLYLPLGALLAASCLVEGVEALATLPGQWRNWKWSDWLAKAGAAALLAALLAGFLHFTLSNCRFQVVRPGLHLQIWLLALGLSGPLALVGARNGAVAVLLLALTAWPLQRLSQEAQETNEHTLHQLRFVIENSLAHETVLDGWTSRAPFRPHAYRYYFLHAEMRSMLEESDREQFLKDLLAARIAPRLIMLDADLSSFCPAALPYYHEHYVPTPVAPIWIRRNASRLPPR